MARQLVVARPASMQVQIDRTPQRRWTTDQAYAVGYDRAFRAALGTEDPEDDPVQAHDDSLDHRDPIAVTYPDGEEAYAAGVREGAEDGMATKWGGP